MDDPALSDEDVYELLHQALLSFSNRTAASTRAGDVLELASHQLEILQKALIILTEGNGSNET